MTKKKSSDHHVGWAEMVQNVIIRAIDRGQLPVLGLISAVLFLIYRMSENDVSLVTQNILEMSKNKVFFVYPVTAFSIFGWIVHVKILKKQADKETRRIGKEKSDLQNKASSQPFKSSEEK